MAYFQENMEQTTGGRSQKEYKLYVDNLPHELTEDGIKHIFDAYGRILGLFYRPEATWAFIVYGTYSEAEYAIRDLNEKAPLYLKVSFAKEKQMHKENQNKCYIPEYIENQVQDFPSNDIPSIQSIGRGRLIHGAYKNISSPYSFDPYQSPDPYVHTNILWSRGHLVSQDGKRHVTLGRGYTHYEIPEPYPGIEAYINKVHEKRSAGLYEHGEDTLKHEIGKCIYCLNMTKMKCERCFSFYCSRECQVADWQQHKIECQTLPGLIQGISNTSISRACNDEQILESKSPSSATITLRRPKTVLHSLTQQHGDATNNDEKKGVQMAHKDSISNNTIKIAEKNEIQDTEERESSHFSNISNRYRKISEQQQHSNNFDCHKEVQRLHFNNPDDRRKDNMKQNYNLNDNQAMSKEKLEDYISHAIKTEESLEFLETSLSKTKFTEVEIVVMIEECQYWVHKKENMSHLQELMIQLQKIGSQKSQVKPIIGKIYAVQYEGLWHRAAVISLNPTRVHYIDYGNYELIEDNNIQEINQNELKNLPPFAVKICLPKSTQQKLGELQFGQTLLVKAITSIPQKGFLVEVKDDTIKNNTNTSSTSSPSNVKRDTTGVNNSVPLETSDLSTTIINKLSSVLRDLEENTNGHMEINALLKDNTYAVTLLPNNRSSEYLHILKTLSTKCSQTPIDINYKPCREELVCCKEKENTDWNRGYLVSLTSAMKMVAVDKACVMQVNQVVPCPKNYSNMPTLGCLCEIHKNDKIEPGMLYRFKIISKEQNCIEIEIMIEDYLTKGIIKPWVPELKQKMTFYQLKNGSEVKIVSYHSPYKLSVRSLDPANMEKFQTTLQAVGKCAVNAPALQVLPSVEDVVIARYVDSNFYRAIVLKVESTTKITIKYMDFGNVEVTTLQKLKVLPDKFKDYTTTITTVVLKGVPMDVPMNEEVSAYLGNLTGKKTPLMCTFDENSCKDGVELKLACGESVNERINRLLVPSWKRKDEEEDKRAYMLEDISIASLGKVGETVMAYLLCAVLPGFKYVMCPHDIELLNHIGSVMPSLLNEYCKSSEYYIPRKNELCLALYNNEWYRAVCLDNEGSDKYQVFYIDYGNVEVVSSKDIRLMTKDFLEPKALASICTIVNLAPIKNGTYSPEVLEKITKLIVENEFIKIKIVACPSAGDYEVELPDIHAKLIQEHLIPAS